MKIFIWISTIIIVVGAGYIFLKPNTFKEGLASLKDSPVSNQPPLREARPSLTDTVVEDNSIENIVGRWQSVDDEKSIKLFQDDGVALEIYDGKVLNTGTWEITNETAEDGTLASMMVIMDVEGFPYTIVRATRTELELTYLPRGNTLNFVRVTE